MIKGMNCLITDSGVSATSLNLNPEFVVWLIKFAVTFSAT